MAKKKKKTLHVSGEDHHKSVLCESQVREIRRCYAAGEASIGYIADEYNVSRSTIWDIIQRKNWKGVE